ncbi:hypothetical protein QBC37DRAFT_295331 [Rhypophila decipiens]|uniref:Uncharacterized protein n=1 Tax=Rhypophila decipiens TaxID=261697 RepID=A0AAN6XYL1_9PEZI|nr:hypothetical protein QBC37DRAFT_295331 [Rhypophila decipiens]
MLTKSAVLAVLAFASAVMAAPQPTLSPVARAAAGKAETFDHVKWGLAHGGAIDIAEKFRGVKPTGTKPVEAPTPTPTAAPDLANREVKERGASQWTISVVNRLGRDIMTMHALGWQASPPIRGNTGQGVLRNGESGSIVVPQGWHGNIPIVESGGIRRFQGDESQIEGSFVQQGGWEYILDINVSYVTGFSVPITCSCDVGVIGGCNKWLWDMGRCPNDNGVGSCKNPERDSRGPANAFFKPCEHAAYTYAYDDEANTGNGICGGDTVTCCVGTDCPRNPRQPW